MSYLEELKTQRRELDRKIKEIQNGNTVKCGDAKYEHRVYPTGMSEERIAVNRITNAVRYGYGKSRDYWACIITEDTKEEAVARLKKVIDDLQLLLKKLEA